MVQKLIKWFWTSGWVLFPGLVHWSKISLCITWTSFLWELRLDQFKNVIFIPISTPKTLCYVYGFPNEIKLEGKG